MARTLSSPLRTTEAGRSPVDEEKLIHTMRRRSEQIPAEPFCNVNAMRRPQHDVMLSQANAQTYLASTPERERRKSDHPAPERRLMSAGVALPHRHVGVSAEKQEFDVVLREALVDTDQRQVLRARLRTHHSVERIGMMRCQAACQQSV